MICMKANVSLSISLLAYIGHILEFHTLAYIIIFLGLRRYKIEDILQVTGFYNRTHQFRSMRRKVVVLSLQMEVTTEEHI